MDASETPDEPSTYAVGDLHGEVRLLRRMLALLPVRPEDTLLFIGDYLDRGEDSAATINALRELASKRPVIFLRGNHEDAWLDETIWDGDHFRRPAEIGGARKAWRDFGGAPPADLRDWLAATLIDYEDRHGFYVHAGVLPNYAVKETSEWQKLYGAGNFLESDYDWGKPVVFGHWQQPKPLLEPNKIGIDTGAYRTGILTAVRLPDRAVFQVRRPAGDHQARRPHHSR